MTFIILFWKHLQKDYSYSLYFCHIYIFILKRFPFFTESEYNKTNKLTEPITCVNCEYITVNLMGVSIYLATPIHPLLKQHLTTFTFIKYISGAGQSLLGHFNTWSVKKLIYYVDTSSRLREIKSLWEVQIIY